MTSKNIAIAVAIILVLGIVGGLGAWFTRPMAPHIPGVWNEKAIDASFAGIRVQQADPSDAAIVFLYDLDNRSGSDYRVGDAAGLVIMGRLKSTGSLSPETEFRVDSAIFLPAGNRTRILLQTKRPFRWPARMDAAAQAQFRDMVNNAVSDVTGFVVFDSSTHYQIDLPGAWQQPPESSIVLPSN